MTRAEANAIMAPLRGICRRKKLSFDWRIDRQADGWRAEVRAGHALNVGARPCWTGSGTTEAQALERAAAGAAYFWDDMAQHGISRTLLDLVTARRSPAR
jgi:hypothetical protein